jgi:hypothetical protein
MYELVKIEGSIKKHMFYTTSVELAKFAAKVMCLSLLIPYDEHLTENCCNINNSFHINTIDSIKDFDTTIVDKQIAFRQKFYQYLQHNPQLVFQALNLNIRF